MLAQETAAQGLNLVLVARNEKALTRAQLEIERNFGVDVRRNSLTNWPLS